MLVPFVGRLVAFVCTRQRILANSENPAVSANVYYQLVNLINLYNVKGILYTLDILLPNASIVVKSMPV